MRLGITFSTVLHASDPTSANNRNVIGTYSYTRTLSVYRCTHCAAGIEGGGTITLAFFFSSSSSSSSSYFFCFFFIEVFFFFFFFFISFVHRSTAAADPVIRFSTEHFAKTDFSIRKCREGYSAGLRTVTPGNEIKITSGRSSPFYGQFSSILFP